MYFLLICWPRTFSWLRNYVAVLAKIIISLNNEYLGRYNVSGKYTTLFLIGCIICIRRKLLTRVSEHLCRAFSIGIGTNNSRHTPSHFPPLFTVWWNVVKANDAIAVQQYCLQVSLQRQPWWLRKYNLRPHCDMPTHFEINYYCGLSIDFLILLD